MSELIRDLALAILMAWLVGVGAHLIRQPLLLAYLVAGFALGPSGLRWIKSQESIAAIAELGLIFLLFMIGMEIDLKKIIGAGKVIVITAATQILGCCALGVALSGCARPAGSVRDPLPGGSTQSEQPAIRDHPGVGCACRHPGRGCAAGEPLRAAVF